MSLKNEIIDLLKVTPELTDREITNTLRGTIAAQQPVNQICRQLESKGILTRNKRKDGLIGNSIKSEVVILEDNPEISVSMHGQNISNKKSREDYLCEDEIKQILDNHLKNKGWTTQIAWGRQKGIDIDAFREEERWIIEVKGSGSLNAMRVNYFLAILGETLQRMNDPKAKYSIALPHMNQFVNLWERLPKLAKQKTGITALFVDNHGNIIELL